MFDAYGAMAIDEMVEAVQKEDLQFPIYTRTSDDLLYFKILSRTEWLSIRTDAMVRGIAISDNMDIRIFVRIYCMAERGEAAVFEKKFHDILNELNNKQ